MIYHVKELQFNARVSKPDPRFARLLLEQFGGGNGELKAAMQYFVQAFACKNPHPQIYDMLMDIAAEELSHLEIVGATIQMLLTGINGELKDIADEAEINETMKGNSAKEEFIHAATINPQFGVLSGGSPMLTDSNGIPWCGSYVNANGEPTVDLRSNIAAESRAKIVYEYLFKYTDDPYVKETLSFLITREIVHFQQFEAALETIEPNFPPGVLQGNPKYSNLYFNMSKGEDARGPWNEGKSSRLNEEWQYIDNVQECVSMSNGLTELEPEGTDRTEKSVREMNKKVSRQKSQEIKNSTPEKDIHWSKFNNKSKDN